MRKLAIIGASYLQAPLIEKAKKDGIETHVFAWECGDVGEKLADFFYPISIIEKELILEKCREIEIDGICSIASDLAMITVNYVAQNMGLTSNSMECTKISTNKHYMRERFFECGDPSPSSYMVENLDDVKGINLSFPAIVKPLDRSGSRGITKVYSENELENAIECAKAEGFDKHALVEEFAEGDEYSVEYISWKGKHQFLAMTKKYTTGSPHFIETGHIQPAPVSEKVLEKIKEIVPHALDSLMIEYGATHTELKIDSNDNIKIIEIGGRMGGDFIGSSLVELSTGYDFVQAVIDVALGVEPRCLSLNENNAAAVKFIFNEDDVIKYNEIKKAYPKMLVDSSFTEEFDHEVVDSSTRYGYYIMKTENVNDLLDLL